MSDSIKYRPDIDGLRAIAVIPVVWYHAGLPGLPGGFTGVDTFFVISGFLITAIIHREVRAGTFTFASFYERRLRRIAPMLLVVILASLVVGSSLMLPLELVALAKSGVAALLMLPNVWFWTEAGYFKLGANFTPLLHTWSLGVEEQFYLFFPIALILARRFDRWLIAGTAVASLALCIFATPLYPSASFYLLPTRAWELMAGGMIAVGLVSIPQRLRSITSLVGLGLLVAAALVIDEQDLFPGFLALLPVGGAVLLIAAGPEAPANRLLSLRPFVWLGKRSYSLYLWHWPVFVFLRYRLGDFGPEIAALAILGAIALSELSYRFVEAPFRRGTSLRAVALRSAGAAGVAVTTCAAIVILAGMPQRFPERALLALKASNDLPPMAHSCVMAPIGDDKCTVGDGPVTAVVWGDSHAAAEGWAIAQGLGRTSAVVAANSCPPAVGWAPARLKGEMGSRCVERNDAVIRRLDNDVRTVVLSAYWGSYARRNGLDFWDAQQATIDELTSRGKRVVILAGIPDPGFDVPRAAALAIARGEKSPEISCPVASIPLRGAEIIDVSGRFCEHPSPLRLFTDGNHVSRLAGADIITPAVREWVFPNARSEI